MQRSSLPVGLQTLKKWYESQDKILRFDLPFQRSAGQWNNYTKSSLVWSLLADSYVPPIVLLKNKAGVDAKGKDIYHFQALDGKQRLTSLFEFMNDEYALNGVTPEVEVEGTVYDLAGLKFSDLSEECKDAIKNYRFSVQNLENYTLDEAESLFFNINSGVALSTVQKSKSKMGTELISFFNEILKGSFFTQAINITDAQARREDDLLLLLQSALLLRNKYYDYSYKNISAATCLNFAEAIRGKYNEEEYDKLKEIFEYLDEVFPTRNKFLRKNNVPIVAVIADTALSVGKTPQEFRAFINDFSNASNIVYEDASGSGNVKAYKVQMRLRVMFLEFCKYFDLEPESLEPPFSVEISLFMDEEAVTPEDNEEVTEPVTDPVEDDSSFEEVTEPSEDEISSEELPVEDTSFEESEEDTVSDEELVENSEVLSEEFSSNEGAADDGEKD